MPSKLKISRLVVYTNTGSVAYDEKFHHGINIIRGENSSGKSTITHFIFYVLGGAFNDWVKEAKDCSKVISEVEFNGAVITLKRNLSFNDEGRANDKEGIYFYWGEFNEAISSEENWYYFGYKTLDNKKSFSNVLFESLDIPIVKGDNNITFHQLLRLMYIDQDSPTNSLFYYEQFDTTLTRETVAELLLGVYNQELYDKKQRLIEVEKDLDDIKNEIRVIKRFNQDPNNLIPANLKTKIDNKQKEIVRIESDIIELSAKKKQVRFTEKTKLEFEKLTETAITQRKIVKELTEKIRLLKFEIEDTDYFINALENKLSAIKNSIATRNYLGEFQIEYCPECLNELPASNDTNLCKLCKNPIDDHYGISKAKKIEQEISFQLKESKKINDSKNRILLDLSTKYESEKINLNQIQDKVNYTLNDVGSYREEKINQLYTDKGFIEGEIIQYQTLLENAELYQSLEKRRAELDSEVSVLKFSIDKLIQDQENLKSDINKSIEKKGVYLLNNDLKRQDEFFEAREFHIDYRNNIAFISDKEAKYSASSSFYLKNSARFSIFLASLKITRMRYPRFVLCDNMEDKGIEKERAQNFQRILVKEMLNYKNEDYQIIYTTSFIPDELNNNTYCVGEYYTQQNRSLKFNTN